VPIYEGLPTPASRRGELVCGDCGNLSQGAAPLIAVERFAGEIDTTVARERSLSKRIVEAQKNQNPRRFPAEGLELLKV